MNNKNIWSLDESLGFLITGVARTIKRTLDTRLAGWNLTAGQFVVLARLWEQDGLSVSELGERLGFDNPTLTGIIDRLEREGVVERRRCREDRRVVRVDMTDKGKGLHRRIGLLAANVDAAALTGLTASQRQELMGSLRQIAKTLTQ